MAITASTLLRFAAHATDLSLGSVAVLPGGTAQMSLLVSNAAPNISAFAVWLTNAPGFATPSIVPGPAQTNLTVFIDARGNGLLRVTGLILSGPPVTNGAVALLQFTAPAQAAPGTYPVLVAGAISPNPELRALITNDQLPAVGANGLILVTGPLRLTALSHTGSTFQFAFDGPSDLNYTVQASTNLQDWLAIGVATMISPGLFQFTDSDANLFPHRFYRVRVP